MESGKNRSQKKRNLLPKARSPSGLYKNYPELIFYFTLILHRMNERLLANLYIAIDAVIANKMRSLLTALGIIFGVAAVIAMLAIGNGAQQEILEQIKLVGVNNIVIKPIIEQKEEAVDEANSKEKKKYSPGLTIRDVHGIQNTIAGIDKISPEILLETFIIKSGVRRSAKLVGVDPVYFEIYDFTLSDGQPFN